MTPFSKRLENRKHVIKQKLDRCNTPTADISKPYIISDTEIESVFKENG